ncbi:hypothetical protein SCLCIDRAFT_75972, partial [Scleroderma citrinum Foug A]
FAYTCNSSSLSGTMLTAYCQLKDGSYGWSSLDLNSCLVNTNGILYCSQNGDYGATCSSCSLSGTVLGCTCQDSQQAGQSASIDLNSCVTNNNGVLTC